MQNSSTKFPMDTAEWTKQVERPSKLQVSEEILARQRISAKGTLENQWMDFRTISWSYLSNFWQEIKARKRMKGVKLFTLLNNPDRTYSLLERSHNSYYLLGDDGQSLSVKKTEVVEKPVEQWTLADICNFGIFERARKMHTANTNGNQNLNGSSTNESGKGAAKQSRANYIDSLLPGQYGEAFQGSFVTVPRECRFDSLYDALRRHFKRKKDEIIAERQLERDIASKNLSDKSLKNNSGENGEIERRRERFESFETFAGDEQGNQKMEDFAEEFQAESPELNSPRNKSKMRKKGQKISTLEKEKIEFFVWLDIFSMNHIERRKLAAANSATPIYHQNSNATNNTNTTNESKNTKNTANGNKKTLDPAEVQRMNMKILSGSIFVESATSIVTSETDLNDDLDNAITGKINPENAKYREEIGDEKLQAFKLVNHVTFEMINLFDERLVFIDDWKYPTIFKRSWCLWEVLGVISCFKGFQFVYDRETAKKFYEILDDDEVNTFHTKASLSNFHYNYKSENIFSAIESLDPSCLHCSNEIDKKVIRDALSSFNSGFSHLIHILRKHFCKEIAIKLDDDALLTMKQLNSIKKKNSVKIFGVCVFLTQSGIFMRKINELNVALKYFDKAIELHKYQASFKEDKNEIDSANESIAMLHINKAKTNILKGDLKLATANINEAVNLCESKQGDNLGIAISTEISLTMAEIHLLQQNYDMALEEYNDLLAYFDKENFTKLKIRRQRRRVIGLDRNDESVVFNDVNIDDLNPGGIGANKFTLEENMVNVRMLVGDIHRERKKSFGEAEYNYQIAAELLDKIGKLDSFEYAQVLFNLGDLRLKKGSFLEALEKFRKSLEIYEKLVGSCNPKIGEIHERIGECRSNLGDEKFKDDLRRCLKVYREYYGKHSLNANRILSLLKQ